MAAFMKMGDIKGESTDAGHKDWIIIDNASAGIQRSIPQGAKDQQRTKGETTLGDLVVVRQLDKSSTKLQEACANGTFFPVVELHFCTTVKNRQEPYLTYMMKNVVVTSYGFHGNSSGSPLPSEQVSIGFTEVEWTYILVDPESGDKKGNVPAKYKPGEGKS